MSNSGLDQFWGQAPRQQQPQGLDIVEIVRHVVPAVLSSLSAGQHAPQQWNNAQGFAGNFGLQNAGQSNFGQQQGYGSQGNNQLQPHQLGQLIQAVVPAVLNALSATQQGGSQNWGQQRFNAGAFNSLDFNSLGNAQQAYGQQGNNQWQQPQQLGQLIQAIVPAVLSAVAIAQQGGSQNREAQHFNPDAFSNLGGNAQQQNYGQQQSNNQLQPQQLGQLIQAILPAIVNAASAGQQGGSQNREAQHFNPDAFFNLGGHAQQQNYGQQQGNNQLQPQQLGQLIQAIVPAIVNAASAGQQWNNAQQRGGYDQQQQQLQGVDLSLLIKAIVPDITKAVVPIVLSTLSAPQQQSRHVN